jgi:hypothetical protein
LPDSRRYADSVEDMNDLISRQNAVASYVLGRERPCSVFFTGFGEDVSENYSRIFAESGLHPVYAMSRHEDDDDLMDFFVADTVWREGELDKIIVAAANDELCPVVFVNFSICGMYAPYDGGADLFFSSREEMLIARDRFRSWISKREDGL